MPSSALAFLLVLLALAPLPARAMPGHGPEQDTLLLAASLEGSEADVARLLDAGAHPDARRDDGWTALMLAAMNGHTPIVRRLLDAGATVDLGSDDDGTPLCVAAVSPIDPPEGSTTIVRLLLARGADLNKGNAARMTPLIFACREGKTEVVRELIAAGADVNRTDDRTWTPLRFAARGGDTATLALLLAAHANPNVREIDSHLTPLDHAVAGGNPAVVRMLLRAGADPNGFPVASGINPSPLIRAVQNTSLPIVKLLVAAHANPNLAVSNEDGDRLVGALDVATALKDRPMMALLRNAGGRLDIDAIYRSLITSVEKDDASAVRKLVRAGIDPRMGVGSGDSSYSFLREATLRGNAGVVAALLEFPYPHDPPELYRAYDLARENAHAQIVELLISHAPAALAPEAAEHDDTELLHRALAVSDTIIGMSIYGGESLLHIAADTRSRGAVELLLNSGARIVPDAWSGRTPIYPAAQRGDAEIVAMLIAAGDSVNHRDRSMMTPLHVAASSMHPDVIALLVAAGAEIEAADDVGWRALHFAARTGDSSTIRKLLQLGADRTARTARNQRPFDVATDAGMSMVTGILE